MPRCRFATVSLAPIVLSLGCRAHPPAGETGLEGGVAPVADSSVGDAPAPDAALPDAAPPSPPGAPDAGVDGGVEFDLGADFSFARNPNGVWRYGYTTGATLAVDQFALDTFVPDSGADPIGFWHPADPATNGAGYYPYVAENSGPISASEEASWALRAGEVAMEGSSSGQYGVVQFVAPFAGVYRIEAHFEGIHFRISSTDVHVLAGDAGLFASSIQGYGGDPAFHPVEGTSPTADYQGAVSLQASDILSFAIGYGADMQNYNDTTGLTVHLTVLGR